MGLAKNWHNQSAIEVVITHFAGWLRDQRATMTCGTVEQPSFDALARAVVGADWIIRAQGSQPERMRQMILQVPCLLDQSSQGAIGIWASGVEQ
jgi:hypothetical protein